jgi:hypothetical protein
MASVDVMTAAHIQALVNACVATATIDSSGFLTLTLADGVTTIAVGQVTTSAITDALVQSAVIDSSHNLILTLGDGVTTINVGSVNPAPALVDPALSLTPAANFSVTSFSARTKNGLAAIFATLGYSGSTLTGTSLGNIPDTLCGTLPVGLRPALQGYHAFDFTIGSGGSDGMMRANTDGTLTLLTLPSTATLSSGETVRFGFTHLLA